MSMTSTILHSPVSSHSGKKQNKTVSSVSSFLPDVIHIFSEKFNSGTHFLFSFHLKILKQMARKVSHEQYCTLNYEWCSAQQPQSHPRAILFCSWYSKPPLSFMHYISWAWPGYTACSSSERRGLDSIPVLRRHHSGWKQNENRKSFAPPKKFLLKRP